MPILSPNQQWQGLRVIGSEVSAADFPFAGKPDVASVIPLGTFRVVHVLANAVRRSCAVGVTGMDLLTPISPGIIQTCLWPLIAHSYLRGGLSSPVIPLTPVCTSLVDSVSREEKLTLMHLEEIVTHRYKKTFSFQHVNVPHSQTQPEWHLHSYTHIHLHCFHSHYLTLPYLTGKVCYRLVLRPPVGPMHIPALTLRLLEPLGSF